MSQSWNESNILKLFVREAEPIIPRHTTEYSCYSNKSVQNHKAREVGGQINRWCGLEVCGTFTKQFNERVPLFRGKCAHTKPLVQIMYSVR